MKSKRIPATPNSPRSFYFPVSANKSSSMAARKRLGSRVCQQTSARSLGNLLNVFEEKLLLRGSVPNIDKLSNAK
jgi:hypothetical protein